MHRAQRPRKAVLRHDRNAEGACHGRAPHRSRSRRASCCAATAAAKSKPSGPRPPRRAAPPDRPVRHPAPATRSRSTASPASAAEPMELTAARAPDRELAGSAKEAVPEFPPLIAPERRPHPRAGIAERHRRVRPPRQAASPRARQGGGLPSRRTSGVSRSNRIAAGTTGTSACAHPVAAPLPRAARPSRHPPPRAHRPSRPRAPLRAPPRPWSPGASASVSRVPGPPPRLSTAATAGRVGQHHGGAGGKPAVLGIADPDAGHVGDGVARAGGRQGIGHGQGPPGAVGGSRKQ